MFEKREVEWHAQLKEIQDVSNKDKKKLKRSQKKKECGTSLVTEQFWGQLDIFSVIAVLQSLKLEKWKMGINISKDRF